MSTIINPNYNSAPRQIELNKQKILEILEKITNLFAYNGDLGNESTTILKSNILDVDNTPNLGDFVIDSKNNLFQITGQADSENFYGTFVSNIQGPQGEQGKDGLSLGNNAWYFLYKKQVSVPSSKIISLNLIDIVSPYFSFEECQVGDLVIFFDYTSTASNVNSSNAGLFIGYITVKGEDFINVYSEYRFRYNASFGNISSLGNVTQNLNISISQNANGDFNIYIPAMQALFTTTGNYTINDNVNFTYSLPLKGSDSVVVDISEDNKSLEIHLDGNIINDLSRTLKSPINTPLTTEIIAIDNTGSQKMLQLGEGLSIVNDTIVRGPISKELVYLNSRNIVSNVTMDDYLNYSLINIIGYETTNENYVTLTIPTSIITPSKVFQIEMNNSSNNRYAKISFPSSTLVSITDIDTFNVLSIYGVK